MVENCHGACDLDIDFVEETICCGISEICRCRRGNVGNKTVFVQSVLFFIVYLKIILIILY